MGDSRSRMVRVGELQLNARDWGGVNKPLLVLLHGLASSSHMFDLIAPILSAAYHVISYDQRGHGLSDKPESGYDFETIAADLEQLIDALGFGGQSVTLAGHSWGASTVLYYAATRPAQVRKAILIDGARSPAREHFTSLEAMAPPQRSNWSLDDVKRMIREDWLGPVWRPELEPMVLAIYDQSNPAGVKPYLTLANHMQIAAALYEFMPTDFYARVQCPILRINAVRDGLPDAPTLANTAEAQRLSRNQEVVWMLDTIHDIPLQRPEALAEIMRGFLLKSD